MRQLIIYGAGKRLPLALKKLSQNEEADLLEIWDRSEKEAGEVYTFKEKEIKVQKPHELSAGSDIDIIVTPDGLFSEIKTGLMDEFHIPEKYIFPHEYVYSTEKKQILAKYQGDRDFQLQRILDYLNCHDLDIWCGQMSDELHRLIHSIIVGCDEQAGLFYTFWHDRKMYLKRSLSNEQAVRNYVYSLLIEQLSASPHQYKADGYEVSDGDVVVDAGAAEGFFTLDNIEKSCRFFLVEADPEWVEALQYTFRPYMDKVRIIEKYLGDTNEENTITLDSINHGEINYVKMDIEGYEYSAIHSVENSLLAANRNLTFAIAVYHHSGYAEKISSILLDRHFEVRYSDGFMYFPYGDEETSDDLRHSLVFARKCRKTPILLWGAGKRAEAVERCLDHNKVVINGMLDIKHDSTEGLIWNDGIRIFHPSEAAKLDYECIVVTADLSPEVFLDSASRYGIDTGSLLFFWQDAVEDRDIFNRQAVRLLFADVQNRKLRIQLENAPYEYGKGITPKILPAEELLLKILKEKKSLCRFGDGEFDLILNQRRPWFQVPNEKLAQRLKEVLNADQEQAIIAIADNFGSLEQYTDTAADDIREYLCDGKREQVYSLLNMQRIYYDTYVSRCYLIYRDKSRADTIFDLFKQIFAERNILLVEGENSWFGMNNDLLDGALSIRRVKCPPRDAFSQYEMIYQTVLQHARKDDLICVSLGPTATVLCYDLAMSGFQALDIGQLDNEYDWFNMKVDHRVEIPGKCVAEVSWAHEPKVKPEGQYLEQIVAEV